MKKKMGHLQKFLKCACVRVFYADDIFTACLFSLRLELEKNSVQKFMERIFSSRA